MTIEFECPICLDNIKYSAVGSCTHHFCYYCLCRHIKFSNECPMCKAKINEIKIDNEFNSLVNNDEIFPTLKYNNEILLYPIENIKNPGITIKNNLKGPGVIISKIKSTGLFSKYNFVVGDTLLLVNGVPCYNHQFVVKQIMSLFEKNKIIKIVKLF
jgi:hypothetical protein